MTASPLPNGKQQFVDINGAPLVGGTVGFYLPATLTPKNTWQNAEQTVLNTNPVVLNSRGQAIIYGTGSYRQILKDSAGNVIWDVEVAGFQESVFGPQESIASATTTDLGTASSNNVLISGTTTINSFGTSASLSNPIYFIQFSNILTLTYNATSMILPGAANITTAANDSALVEYINASGYWRMIAYFPNSGAAALGTAASKNIGTSGGTVPLLNGGNTWAGIQIFQKQVYSPEIPLTPVAGVLGLDFAVGNNFSVSTSANLFIGSPNNAQQGQSGIIAITQGAASLNLSWGSAYKAPGGISNVSFSGVNGATDYFAYYNHSGSFVLITPLLNPT